MCLSHTPDEATWTSEGHSTLDVLNADFLISRQTHSYCGRKQLVICWKQNSWRHSLFLSFSLFSPSFLSADQQILLALVPDPSRIWPLSLLLSPCSRSLKSLVRNTAPASPHFLTSLYSLSLSADSSADKSSSWPPSHPRNAPSSRSLCQWALHIPKLYTYRNLLKGFLCTVADHLLTLGVPLRKCVRIILRLGPVSLHRPSHHLPHSSFPPHSFTRLCFPQ